MLDFSPSTAMPHLPPASAIVREETRQRGRRAAGDLPPDEPPNPPDPTDPPGTPDDDDDVPETPPTEPQPVPIQDPPAPTQPQGPYVVKQSVH